MGDEKTRSKRKEFKKRRSAPKTVLLVVLVGVGVCVAAFVLIAYTSIDKPSPKKVLELAELGLAHVTKAHEPEGLGALQAEYNEMGCGAVTFIDRDWANRMSVLFGGDGDEAVADQISCSKTTVAPPADLTCERLAAMYHRAIPNTEQITISISSPPSIDPNGGCSGTYSADGKRLADDEQSSEP